MVPSKGEAMQIAILLIVIVNLMAMVIYAFVYKDRLTYVHYLSALFILSNIVKPVAILIYGESLLYQTLYSDIQYAQALLYASVCYWLYLLGFQLFWSRKNADTLLATTSKTGTYPLFDWFNLLLCVLGLGAMFISLGTSFLVTNRTSSISAAFPMLRYFYPFLLISSALLIAQGFNLILDKNRLFQAGLFSLVGFGTTMAIAQRGFALSALVFIALLYFQFSLKINKKLAVLVVVFIFVVFSRNIAFTVFSGLDKAAPATRMSMAEKIVRTPDGDSTEVWMVVLALVEKKGFLWGQSIINSAFVLLPNNVRVALGVPTGLDQLNLFYTGPSYLTLKFGFNVNAAQELFLNFGPLSFLIQFFGGVFVAKAYQFAARNIESRQEYIYYMLPVLAAINAASSFAGLQWSLLMIGYYVGFLVIKKMTNRKEIMLADRPLA